MEIQYEKTGPCTGKLSITIPATKVDEVFKRLYQKVARDAQVPGFRPGKAPRQILEARYGDQVRNDALEALVSESLFSALKEKDVPAVGRPSLAPGKLERGTDFSYTAAVDLQPEVKIETYEGLEVPNFTGTVADAEVDIELEKIRKQAVQVVPILERDIVQDGDLVLADFQGTQGGMPLKGAKAESTLIEIGGDFFLPGVAEALVGAQVPGNRRVPVDFPDDHIVGEWAGKQATFDISLKELKKKELPNLDDEFAQDLGEENLAGLRDKIRAGMLEKANASATRQRRKAAVEALIAANPFELPHSMIEERLDRMIVDAATRLRMMMGPRFDLGDLDLAGLREENRSVAEFEVRAGLLLMEVAQAAGIEVDDSEIDAAIAEEIEAAGEQAERARAHFAEEDARNGVRYRLLEDHTMKLLLEKAKLVEPPVVAADDQET